MPASPASRITWGGSNISANIAKLDAKLQAAIGHIMEYQATEGQNNMRNGASWTDRTGNARGGLMAQSFSETDKFIIVLYHTMPYGFWLEVAHGGKYRIVEPVMKATGRDAMAMTNRLMRKLGGI